MEPLNPEVRSVVAGKMFTMFGVNYQPGDPVDISHLSDWKVTQLLNQRYLRPAHNEQGADAKQTT